MNICEIFYSLQGEGRLTGAPSVFIRLAGCDLHCRWCDTGYALSDKQGRTMTVTDVLTSISTCDCPRVVVTGGEPLLAEELPDLLKALHDEGQHITLETSATRFRELVCDLISISPKLSNTIPQGTVYAQDQERHRLNLTALRHYLVRHDYQLKFVIEEEADLAEVSDILDRLEQGPDGVAVNRDRIFLMPQARTRIELQQRGPRLAQICLARGYRYSPRLQVDLWDDKRGT